MRPAHRQWFGAIPRAVILSFFPRHSIFTGGLRTVCPRSGRVSGTTAARHHSLLRTRAADENLCRRQCVCGVIRAQISWGCGRGDHSVPKNVAASPHRLYVMISPARPSELFAQLADKDVDDFEVRSVHAAIEMVAEHILRQDSALVQAKQLENAVLLTCHLNRLPVYRDDTLLQVYHEFTQADRRYLGLLF